MGTQRTNGRSKGQKRGRSFVQRVSVAPGLVGRQLHKQGSCPSGTYKLRETSRFVRERTSTQEPRAGAVTVVNACSTGKQSGEALCAPGG